MPAWLDSALVFTLVLGAVGYFIWRALQRRRSRGAGCSSGCGCSGAAKDPLKYRKP